MRERNVAAQKFDVSFRARQPIFQQLLMRLFPKRFNSVAIYAIGMAYERSQINSEQMHALAGIVNDACFPYRGASGRPEWIEYDAGRAIAQAQHALPDKASDAAKLGFASWCPKSNTLALLTAALSLFVASVTYADTNTQSQLVFENIIGNLATSNPTISGILTNVVVEGGFSASLQKPLSPHGSLSEAYPLVKISKGAIVETLMFVHSNGVQTQGTPDEFGFGFNTHKRTTPRPMNVAIGTVAPVAHHGVFVNVTVSTSRAVHGRFDLADTFWQAGGYITF